MLDWIDRIDDVDDATAEDLNTIAHAVMDLEDDVGTANTLLENALGGV